MRLVLALSFAIWLSLAVVHATDSRSKALDLVRETTDKLVQQLGWNREEVDVSRVLSQRTGQALVYEFDIELAGSIFPIKLAEEISTWSDVDVDRPTDNKAVVEWNPNEASLAPFQLAGPVELWIQDAKDLRLAIPNDVEAGALHKVLLADGATVTVHGAREISLARPFRVPLPLSGGQSSSMIASISEQLKRASRSSDKPIVSLRVARPSSLVTSPSPSNELDSPAKRLRVKKLSPGAVELSSRVAAAEKLVAESSPERWDSPQSLWPLPSLNSSGANLESLEQALKLLLGARAHRPGSFNLLRARASASRFVKVEFELEKRLSDGGGELPEWATKPSVQRVQFEVLSKVEGDRVVPMSVRSLETYPSPATASVDYFLGNSSGSGMVSSFLPPVSPMTLGVNW